MERLVIDNIIYAFETNIPRHELCFYEIIFEIYPVNHRYFEVKDKSDILSLWLEQKDSNKHIDMIIEMYHDIKSIYMNALCDVANYSVGEVLEMPVYVGCENDYASDEEIRKALEERTSNGMEEYKKKYKDICKTL